VAPGSDFAEVGEVTDLRARKSLGQHFLVDARVADAIAALVKATPGELILEVGSGRGALTAALVRLYGHVIGVEIDRRLSAGLRARFGPQELRLVEGDILHLELAELLAGQVASRLVIVGNLPYNITGPFLGRLLAQRALVDRAVLMVQREVAARLTARPGGKQYGQLTVRLGLWAETRLAMEVDPRAFRPVPRVRSAVVECRFGGEPRHPVEDEALFRRIVCGAFGQRRKMLRNSLAALLPPPCRPHLPGIAAAAGIELTRRPEELSLAEFCRLSDAWGRWAALRLADAGGASA